MATLAVGMFASRLRMATASVGVTPGSLASTFYRILAPPSPTRRQNDTHTQHDNSVRFGNSAYHALRRAWIDTKCVPYYFSVNTSVVAMAVRC